MCVCVLMLRTTGGLNIEQIIQAQGHVLIKQCLKTWLFWQCGLSFWDFFFPRPSFSVTGVFQALVVQMLEAVTHCRAALSGFFLTGTLSPACPRPLTWGLGHHTTYILLGQSQWLLEFLILKLTIQCLRKMTNFGIFRKTSENPCCGYVTIC